MKNSILYLSIFIIFISLTSEKCSRVKPIDSPSIVTEGNAVEEDVTPIKYQFVGDYAPQWKTVDSLNNLGLYKSALEAVQDIYNLARNEKNYPQVIKSQMYKLRYNTYLTDDDYVQAIYEMDSLTENSEFPLKQLSHLLTAKIYYGFYNSNRWTIQGRTHTDEFDNTDIRTWDLRKIAETITYHYKQSVTEANKLKAIATDDFRDILTNSSARDYENMLAFRPTLYDFIVHENLSFFQTAEFGLSESDVRCVLDDDNLLGNNETFLGVKIACNDTLANKIFAAQLLQDLTEMHLKDSDPTALNNISLIRLKFMKNNIVSSKADEIYLATLDDFIGRNVNHESMTEFMYQKANWYFANGDINSEDTKVKYGKKTAHQICEQAIKKFPNSFGANECKYLKNNIEQKYLGVSLEQNLAPNAYHKYLVSFKNINEVYFKLVQLEKDYKIPYNLNKGVASIFDQILLDSKEIKTWNEKTPNKGDFENHNYEQVLDPLSLGKYALLVSADSTFTYGKGNVQYAIFQVTNFALAVNHLGKVNEREYQVYNRMSGETVSDVKVQLYERKYNNKKGEYEYEKLKSFITNKNGAGIFTSKSSYKTIYAELEKGEDYYFDGQGTYYNDYTYDYDDSRTTTYFFLDRKIYRPGQTIYFKGIVVNKSDGVNKVVANKSIKVSLRDVNYQIVKTIDVKTNEYGSYSGQFIAPDEGMNGQMTILDTYGNTYLSVEEYKRPKFEVDFEPIEGSYKINSEVNVVGTAKAFAGNQIDGATVKYRVVRTASFPYWCWYRWGYMPSSGSIEVASGEAVTDESGNFEITFTAKEDQSVNRKFAPTYRYQITADVTDVNGETRSGQTYVYVGVNAMNLSVNIPAELNKDKLSHFKVTTTNLNGQHIDAKVDVKIIKLKTPDKAFRKSVWGPGEIKMFTKEEYEKYFPQDVYDEENKVSNYAVDREMLTERVNTGENDSINYGKKNLWQPGHYKVIATSIDEFGSEVLDERYFTLFDPRHNQPHNTDVLWVKALKTTVQPGDKAQFLVSSKDDILLNYKVIKNNVIVSDKTIPINKEQKLLTFDVEEKDRGGFRVIFSTLKNERDYYENHNVYVPFSNKDLKISLETYRNKMLPGSEEEWKLKISGPKGEKVAAEMVAAMYDASLDEFASNYFSMYISHGVNQSYNYYTQVSKSFKSFGQARFNVYNYGWNSSVSFPNRSYPSLNMFGFYPGYYLRGNNNRYVSYYGNGLPSTGVAESDLDGVYMEAEEDEGGAMDLADNMNESYATTLSKEVAGGAAPPPPASDATISTVFQESPGEASGKDAESMDLTKVQARSNFSETAFFKPHLETNEKGEIILSFTMPESLTEWKFMTMAHTKDLKVGYLTENVITQKDLMVVPNAPRFFREGDKIVLSSKITNLSEELLNGKVQLFLFDALTNEPIDVACNNGDAQKSFEAKSKQSTSVDWEIEIPMGAQAITYKIVAQAGDFSDGEEMSLPVLSNRMLVTESIPLYINKKGEKSFKLQNLIDSKDSESLTHHRVTVEFTSNPAWYAVQALPYMMEYPYECAEQTFSRYYANAIATHIANSNPKIEAVFESWKNVDKEAFLSNLEKNQELKSLILEETPWVLNAKSESENKRRLGLLFDMHKMKKELSKTLKKLQKMQMGSGAWPWFTGMHESRYITQHIVCGMGHLNNLGVINSSVHLSEWKMIKDAVRYLDQEMLEDYQYLLKHSANMDLNHIGYTTLQYLYARSFFDFKMNKDVKEAHDYYLGQAKKYWHNDNLQTEAMTALMLERYDKDGKVQDDIMKSLSEMAIHDEEMGMYYKANRPGFYWYQAPVETQAILIEAFDEVANDNEAVEELKVWLLKQKQTTHWKTTRATSEACYALLLRGTDLLANDEIVEVKLGDMKVEPSKTEAGTGYFKESYAPEKITSEMGNVTVSRKSDGVSWGGLYWQYFEDLDKIKRHETPLAINKKLFKVQLNSKGEYMTPITDNSDLTVGDKVRVRIEIHTDRDLEYVHLKDMRAAGFEPVNVISQYKWQDGLGYYESTKDAATNFFMDYLSKGTYVFEYDMKVFHKGDFSNGITTMQCMYAPEFSSHSEGIRVVVK